METKKFTICIGERAFVSKMSELRWQNSLQYSGPGVYDIGVFSSFLTALIFVVFTTVSYIKVQFQINAGAQINAGTSNKRGQFISNLTV